MNLLTTLRAQFEAGLRDDKCVLVTPQDGLLLLALIEAAKEVALDYRQGGFSTNTYEKYRAALDALDKEQT